MSGVDLPDTLTPEQAARLGFIEAPPKAKKTSADMLPDTLTPEQARKLGFVGGPAAAPVVDMGPEARRARAGLPAERFTSAEQAGTLPGPVTSHVDTLPLGKGMLGDVGFSHSSQEPARADLAPGETVRIASRHPGKGYGVGGLFGQPKTLILGSETGEMADPLVQMGTATALGMASGAPVASTLGRAPGLARLATAATEGAVSNKALGGDLATGAALGVAPMALAAAPRTIARAAKALGPNTEKAIKNARGWVVHDIAGDVKGASTPTARKQLADDAENAATLVLKDKHLDKAIDKAQSGNLESLNEAQAAVQERLQAVNSERLDPHWDAATEALPGGGVKSGDVFDFIKNRSDALKATGRTSDAAEASALDAIYGRISKAKDWGGGSPNTIVPARQAQALWSDEAGIAYDSAGGINGTAAFKKKLDIASHLREFRDGMLDEIAKKDPKTAAELRSANKDYSALKRIETVLDQRINNAKVNAGGASIPQGAKKFVKEFKQHPLGTTLGIVPDALMAGKKAFDKGVARRAVRGAEEAAATPRGEPVSMASGLPLSVAAGAPNAIAPDQSVFHGGRKKSLEYAGRVGEFMRKGMTLQEAVAAADAD